MKDGNAKPNPAENPLDELAEKYESPGLLARLAIIARGIGRKHSTREYKLAKIELQRTFALVVAIVAVVLLVAVVAVMTAISALKPEEYQVTIATVEEPAPPEPPPEPPESDPVDMAKEVDPTLGVSIDIDVPQSEPSEPAVPPPEPGATSAVQPVKSPVSMDVVGAVKLNGIDGGQGSDFGTLIKGGGGGAGGVPKGALVGEIIDLKRNAEGERRDVDYLGGDYWRVVGDLFRKRFSDAAYKEAYRIPRRVALTHVWIPPQSAENGPKAFGADELMEPKYWLAHYTGELVPARSMRCRFFGYFDDCMVVAVDGKVVLDVFYAMQPGQASPTTGWKTPDPAASRWTAPQGACKMMAGDWIDFTAGKPVRIDIAFGEKPGGALGGLLCIEEAGAVYDKTPEGRPKWPVFASRPLAITEKMKLEEAAYGIGVDSPRFNAKPSGSSDYTKGDVEVEVTL